jgi:hypothetical protein
MSLPFTRLIDARVWIVARASKVSDMPEQVSCRILHPQVAEVDADDKKRNRCLACGPTLNRQSFDQNKPSAFEHFIE